ncbi:MAG: hypothetical protein IPL61_06540 [Myxococcales bacterium]|nr:hypothetical protein [Myxococcales bacterium]
MRAPSVVVDAGTCAATETDWLTRQALGLAAGILELAQRWGRAVHALCAAYASKHAGLCDVADHRPGTAAGFAANVSVERDGDLAVVRVFRPEVKNALSKKTIGEIDRAITELLAADRVKGIVFSSSDLSLAGADINELAALPSSEACRAVS